MVAEPSEAMKSKQNDRKQKGQYKLTNRHLNKKTKNKNNTWEKTKNNSN